MSLVPQASTVDGILRRSAAKFRDRTALTFADRVWTYGQLDAAVSRAAAHLLSLGLDPETAERDAEGIEHHVSERTLALFAAFVARN